MKKFIKNKNKYFYISGIIALILIYLVAGSFSVYSYLIAGLWSGFWLGIYFVNKKLDDLNNQIEKLEEKLEHNKNL